MKMVIKYRKYIILAAIIMLFISALLLVLNLLNNDGMNNRYIYNVQYKVYQNGKWTKYSRNGITSGDKNSPIQNLDFKYKKDQGSIFYNIYDKEWSSQMYGAMGSKPKYIYGLKISSGNLLYKKYDVCYRTYNKKDKWLNWTCNGEISGNKKDPITAIEVKLIPKNVIKFDYLRDFNKVLESERNF